MLKNALFSLLKYQNLSVIQLDGKSRSKKKKRQLNINGTKVLILEARIYAKTYKIFKILGSELKKNIVKNVKKLNCTIRF